MSARSRLDAVQVVTPRQWRPSELATPERVRALLATDLDVVTRAHLEQRLADMETPAPATDPFRGLQMGADDSGWWSA